MFIYADSSCVILASNSCIVFTINGTSFDWSIDCGIISVCVDDQVVLLAYIPVILFPNSEQILCQFCLVFSYGRDRSKQCLGHQIGLVLNCD